MGARAVIAVDELTGTQTSQPRWFCSGSASPEFLVPNLADFYTWTVEQELPLTVASYLRYAADHPGTLPNDESTTPGQLPADLDYFYRLTLNEDQHGLLLRVHDRSTRRAGISVGDPVETLTQANLYEAAARCCDTLAQRCERYAETNAGIAMPGGEPQTWIDRARAYRTRQHSTPIAALAANLAAQFHPATFDTVHPGLQVGGVWVFAYLDRDGVLRVSVHLDQTQAWLLRADGTVALRITVGATDVFTG